MKVRTVCFIFALLTLSAAARAQIASATLSGEVTDESGALAPHVSITARQEATGFSRSTLTGAQGAYRFDELQPGRYTVSAEKPGFRTVTAEDVVLEVNQKARLNLTLKIAAEPGRVTVQGSVSPVQSDDASIGYRLNTTEIDSLPLAQRNVVSLMTVGPGAIPRFLNGFTHDNINDVQENRGAVALNPSVNGSRSYMNAFLLDGAQDTDRNTFAIAVTPPMESVQEFRLLSSLPSAEFSQAGGGIMDVVTKSGALAWHGSAFEYFRNEALDARSFFDDPKLPRPVFRQSQYGGSLGGHVPGTHNTFFFATWEGLRSKAAKASLNIVPDQAVRAGDFSGRNAIFDPLNLDSSTGARLPFAGNAIPSGRIDPVVRGYLDRFEPLPNRTGSSNYLDSTPTVSHNDTGSLRMDRQISDRSRVFGRYTINDERDNLAQFFPALPDAESLRAQQVAVGHTLSGTSWINEGRLSFTRLKVFDTPLSAFKQDVARQLGFTSQPTDPFNYGLPFFTVTDFSIVTDYPSLPQLQRDNLWQTSDGFSITRGRHTWKAGFQWIHAQVNYLQSNLPRGSYTFSGALTANLANPNGTGDGFADFLLGLPQVTDRTVGFAQGYLRENTYGAYLQDDWRVTSHLTVNLGIRYEYFAPFTDARGQLLNLDYSRLPQAPPLAHVGSATAPDRNNFAPRVGLAWTPPATLWPGRKLVVRAGYGIYYSPEIASEAYDLVLNNVRTEHNATDGKTPLLTIENGFPQTASTGFPTEYGIDPRAATPYVQQWNANIQQELPSGVLIEVAYIGSKGTDLGLYRRFNTPAHVETGENLAPRPGDLQSLRTFPGLGTLMQRQHIANSAYHSVQIKAEKRLGRSLSFLTSFVWSKSIDDAGSELPSVYDSAGAQDERNLRLERGLSFFNVGRRLSSGFVYNLPAARGFLLPLLRNWRTSGIVTLQDGTPENPTYFAYDGANSGTVNRPDVVPGQKISLPSSQRTSDHWFNTAAFATPQPFTFGNAGRNIIPGPGIALFDLALHRRFSVKERSAVEFRTEFFNAFNHPNFGVPAPWADFGPFFGKVLVTGDPRRIQLALRFEF